MKLKNLLFKALALMVMGAVVFSAGINLKSSVHAATTYGNDLVTNGSLEGYADALKEVEANCESNWQNFWRFFIKYGRSLDSGANWSPDLLKPFKINE